MLRLRRSSIPSPPAVLPPRQTPHRVPARVPPPRLRASMAPPGHGPRRGARAGLRCSRDLRAPRPPAPALTSAPASQLVPSPDPAPGVPRPRARPRPPHAGPGAHPTPVRSRGRAEGDTTGHIPFSPALPSFTPAPAACTVPVLVPALGSRDTRQRGRGGGDRTAGGTPTPGAHRAARGPRGPAVPRPSCASGATKFRLALSYQSRRAPRRPGADGTSAPPP